MGNFKTTPPPEAIEALKQTLPHAQYIFDKDSQEAIINAKKVGAVAASIFKWWDEYWNYAKMLD